MSDDAPKLRRIKSGFSRGFALARMSMGASARAAGHAARSLFADEEERAEQLRALLGTQMEIVARELGQLKGSVMKVGQMLSMVGEHVLPPEANAFLKTLRADSPPLAWEEIERVLARELGPERLALVEIDEQPMAAASLGQVHRGRLRGDGRAVAIKIQYPGVDRAVDSDLAAFRRMLGMARLLPRGPDVEPLFAEVREMLHREMDYELERAETERFVERLAHDSRYVVPRPVPALCTRRVLTTELEEGAPVDGEAVRALAQERRDALGHAALELFFRELCEFGAVQTDPHFGNYCVRPAPDGRAGEVDRLVLYDFGAVRTFEPSFTGPYFRLLRATVERDDDALDAACLELGALRPDDDDEVRQFMRALCGKLGEPFLGPDAPGVPPALYDAEGRYDWGRSDLPARAAILARDAGPRLMMRMKMRTPPREMVFLNRKMLGVYLFLKELGARIEGRSILERHLP